MKTDNFTIVKDSLHRFIVSNYYDEMSIDSALKDYRIDKFFIPFNEELFSYQISIYNVYKMELMKISKELETYNLKFLVLKGIILADDLYAPYYLRRSMDLDILVEFKDIDIVDNILRVLGYFPINEDFYTNSIKHVKSNKSIREEITHITPYKKIIDDKLINYFLKFFKYSIGLVINFIIIYYLEGLIPTNSLVIWFLKGALIFGISTIINYIYFYVVKELVFMERVKYLLKKFIKGKQKKAA